MPALAGARNPRHPLPRSQARGILRASTNRMRTIMAHEPRYDHGRAADAPPQNTTALGAGFGIGIIWILLAAAALWSSIRGYMNERHDWGLAYLLVGLLLGGAGVAALVGTWWHQTRVVRRSH
jgi:hypothetical protein